MLVQQNAIAPSGAASSLLAHCHELITNAGYTTSEREILDLVIRNYRIQHVIADEYLDRTMDLSNKRRIDAALQIVAERFVDGGDGYAWLLGNEKRAPAMNTSRPNNGSASPNGNSSLDGFAALKQLSTGIKLPGVGETGLVPIKYLRPYRDQPRQYFNPAELEGLRESVVADGVRDIVKVRLLTPEERLAETEFLDALYEIVSGERRWRAARSGGVEALQIYVHEYRDEEEQFEDAYALNEVRAGLTPLENSRALNRILNNRFCGNVAGLMRMTGKSRGAIDQVLCLVHLDQSAQDKLAPEVPDKERLTLKVAFYLYSHCDHEQQRRFMQEAFDPNTSTTQQILWIDQHLRGHESHGANQRYERRPDQGRVRIVNFLATVRSGMLFFSSLSEKNRAHLFRGVSHTGVVALLEQADTAQRELTEWVAMLRKATEGIKHHLEIDGMVEVDYYNVRENEMVRGTVIPLGKYKRLAAEGHLAYQMQEVERPSHLPDPDTIEDE